MLHRTKDDFKFTQVAFIFDLYGEYINVNNIYTPNGGNAACAYNKPLEKQSSTGFCVVDDDGRCV